MKIKDWEDLTIADNFIFGRIMEDYPNLCRHLLEEILKFKIDSLVYLEREKTIETRLESKGIRLDVLAKTPDGKKIFNVEMQVADDDDLARRMRYYQSTMDNDSLEKGQIYRKLSDT